MLNPQPPSNFIFDDGQTHHKPTIVSSSACCTDRPISYKFNPYCDGLLVIYCSVTYIRTNYIVLTVTLTYRPTYHVRPFRHNRDRDPQHPNHGASRSPIGGNVETQPIVHRGTLV